MKTLLTLLCVMAVPASAATDSTCRVRFVSFPVSAEPRTLEVDCGDGRIREVELPSSCLSTTYELPASTRWNLGSHMAGADGEPRFERYGAIAGGDSAEQIVVVVFKGDTAREGVAGTSIDAADFNHGEFLVANFTAGQMATEIGGHRKLLKPGKHAVIAPAANRGEGLCFAMFAVRRSEDWAPFFSSNWPIESASRGLVFFFTPSGSPVPTMHTIVDCG